ncbi:MAG: hypothetical protein AAGF85_02980 [Bacteroidota bacterium]
MINRAKHFFLVFIIITTVPGYYKAVAQSDEKPSIPLDHFYAEPQNGGALRKLLSKLHFSLETGYGRTYYSQDLSEFGILQRSDSLFIFSPDLNTAGGNLTTAYSNWFNTGEVQSDVSFSNADDFLLGGDSTNFKFKSIGTGIPISGMIHIEIDRYKIGGGFIFEYHRVGEFRPSSSGDRINSFDPSFNSALYKKYFVLLGAKVYRYYEWLLSADARIGAYRLGGNFNNNLIQKGIFVNLGATIERELSEYFSAYVRPSFDFKNYTLNLPESNLAVNHSMNALYIGVGVKYRIPENPKCFIKNCTTQINHQHGNSRIYRSRMHPIYKKQNPHHGENYPKPVKYKRKNRRKLNPY